MHSTAQSLLKSIAYTQEFREIFKIFLSLHQKRKDCFFSSENQLRAVNTLSQKHTAQMVSTLWKFISLSLNREFQNKFETLHFWYIPWLKRTVCCPSPPDVIYYRSERSQVLKTSHNNTQVHAVSDLRVAKLKNDFVRTF